MPRRSWTCGDARRGIWCGALSVALGVISACGPASQGVPGQAPPDMAADVAVTRVLGRAPVTTSRVTGALCASGFHAQAVASVFAPGLEPDERVRFMQRLRTAFAPGLEPRVSASSGGTDAWQFTGAGGVVVTVSVSVDQVVVLQRSGCVAEDVRSLELLA